MPPSDDSTPRVPLGPVGRYVIDNLAELRTARRMTYKQLAEELERLGLPIPTLGLSRIEKGTRRVDADDLVALAIALQVNPTALLLPRDAPADGDVELTQHVHFPAAAAWKWADGRIPLPGATDPTGAGQADFMKHARPRWDDGMGTLAAGPPTPISRPRHEDQDQDRQPTGLQAELIQRVEELERRLEQATTHHTEVPVQPVVAAIVTSPLGVLVGRRNDGKPPWTFIAGEQEPGEREEDTAIREVKEETGLRIEAGDVIGERVHPKTGRRMVYMAAAPTHGTDVIVGDEEELAEVKWATLAEVEQLMQPYGMFDPVHDHLRREIGGGTQ